MKLGKTYDELVGLSNPEILVNIGKAASNTGETKIYDYLSAFSTLISDNIGRPCSRF